MHGFYKRILKVNLSDRTFDCEVLDEELYAHYLGGKGLGSYLLQRDNPPGIDPLDPENRLIFATGPLTGNPVWGGCRYGVFTKSPQTGLYSESYSGGKVPEAIDAAGFDAIVIHGVLRHAYSSVHHSRRGRVPRCGRPLGDGDLSGGGHRQGKIRQERRS